MLTATTTVGSQSEQAPPHMPTILDEIMATLECKGEGVMGHGRGRAPVEDGEACRSLAKEMHHLMDSVPLKGGGKRNN